MTHWPEKWLMGYDYSHTVHSVTCRAMGQLVDLTNLTKLLQRLFTDWVDSCLAYIGMQYIYMVSKKPLSQFGFDVPFSERFDPGVDGGGQARSAWIGPPTRTPSVHLISWRSCVLTVRLSALETHLKHWDIENFLLQNFTSNERRSELWM